MSTLNELMSFGHVVFSDGWGKVVSDERTRGILANEVIHLTLDDDGQSLDDDFQDVYTGWTPLQGFTGQYGYNGPVMHPSEYIGGGLETHIRENAGLYVAVVVDGLNADDRDDDTNVGWAILYKSTESE